MAHQQDWTEIATRAQTLLINSIPAAWRIPPEKLPSKDRLDVTSFPGECGLLLEREVRITDSDATTIASRVATREWTAEEVATAFCKRAAVAHQVTKCLTVIMFDEALQRARNLDAHLARGGSTVGPLHGVPISLKDNFQVSGKPSSAGMCAWALQATEQESTIVAILRSLGAIVYVKTNVPTAMMMAETVNNCYGRTLNPLRRTLTPGGSSGGESALIAMRGSPLGVGTDIGGSLRIPAACTGLYTIKPSYGRFPHFDARSVLAGQEAVNSVHGPMARSVRDLLLWCESVVGAEPWKRDPKCIALPWRKVQLNERLKIAVLQDDAIVHPTPPVKRALAHVVEKLKRAGHELVDWPKDDHTEALEILAKFFTADGGKSLRRALEAVHEPLRPEMEQYGTASEMGVYDLWQLQARRTALAKRYLDRWAACEGLDAVLAPTTPFTAPPHGKFKYVGFTGVWNILDYTCTSFPTGVLADQQIDVIQADFQPYGEADNQVWEDYDAASVHGMPVSLQLIGKRLEEEKMLAITERVCADIV